MRNTPLGRMRKLPLVLTLCAASGVGLVATGCGDEETSGAGSAATQQSAGSTKLTVAASGVDAYAYLAVLTIAQEKGWFEEEGLDVELISGQGGGDSIRVVTSGSADMAITSGASVLLAARDPAQGLTVIGPWYQVNDIVWITADEGATLDGATLGVSPGAASTSEQMLKAVQAANPDAGIEGVPVGGLGDNWAAAKSGRITAGASISPATEALMASEPEARILVRAREYAGDPPADLVAVRTEYAEENPEAVKAFWRVAQRVFDYATTDTAAAAEDLGAILPIDPKYIRQAIEEYRAGYTIKVDPKSLASLSDLLVEGGYMDEPIDWATVMDQRYLPEDARADLGGIAD